MPHAPICHTVSAIALSALCLSGVSAASKWSDERDAFAPKVSPKLLYLGSVGAAGDQWFAGIRINRGRVTAKSPAGLTLNVSFDEEDKSRSSVSGGVSIHDKKIPKGLPNGGKVGGISYGYRQVDKILQQPYMRGGGWELWGWSHDQAKSHALMADSRIKAAWPMPNRNVIAVGYADGGNTVFQRHPKDLKTKLGSLMGVGYNITGGGGGGKSAWFFEITGRGGVERAMVFRGDIFNVAWDEWGRIVVGGRGVYRGGNTGISGHTDGAGILMASRDWKKCLFKDQIGKKGEGSKTNGAAWAVAIDSKSGLAAVCGWVNGPLTQSETGKERYGGGKDAFLAVYRLWTPEDYEAAKEAEKAAKKR